MPTYRKRGTRWTAIVRLKGVRKTKTFPTKMAAIVWATQLESDINSGQRGDIPNKTFGDLLEKYRDEVSITKKGLRWEELRINATLRDDLAKINLRDLDERHIAAWRDRRLKEVSNATVRREWNLLSSACTIARMEWKWLKINPFKEVTRPADGEDRDRIATQDEIDRICFVMNYYQDSELKTVTSRVCAAFLFAIETGMREGEIAGLEWSDIQFDRNFCKVTGKRIGAGKTDAAKRDVPLSPEAIRILKQLPRDTELAFSISARQMDSLFRKFRTRAGIENLRFHDSRHTAITRLAKIFEILPLAKMIGHRDLNMLLVYYNPTAEDLAKKF